MYAIEAPEVKEAHGGLLAVANVVRSAEGRTFIEGVTYESTQGTVTREYVEGEDKEFDLDTEVTSEEFTLYKGVDSALFVDTASQTEARNLFGAGETVAVEAAVQRLLLNPVAVDITPTPGTAVTNLRGALGLLQQAAGKAITGQPLIHSNLLGTELMRDLKVDGDSLATKQGTPIANGAGYGATGPGGLVAAAGTAWVYISGQVNLWVSNINAVETQDLKKNRNIILVEAQYVATIDTPVYAILVGI